MRLILDSNPDILTLVKANIHPTFNTDVTVTCACGNTFTTGSTLTTIRVDICSKCHPLYTGTQKLVDTLGQVDRFAKKIEASKVKMEQRRVIEENRKSKVEEVKKDKPSLKDLLMQVRKNVS